LIPHYFSFKMDETTNILGTLRRDEDDGRFRGKGIYVV
jgi:hypothetical protein